MNPYAFPYFLQIKQIVSARISSEAFRQVHLRQNIIPHAKDFETENEMDKCSNPSRFALAS
jgi:isopentenyl diphosphate isomerase/L-lactate dehydrogenase-like FMN-dependent dehydrogenase